MNGKSSRFNTDGAFNSSHHFSMALIWNTIWIFSIYRSCTRHGDLLVADEMVQDRERKKITPEFNLFDIAKTLQSDLLMNVFSFPFFCIHVL